MSVALLCCRLPAAIAGEEWPPGLGLRAVSADRDARDIARLSDAVAGDATVPAAPGPRGGGLLADLASRPGREVEAWLTIMPASDERAVGLISLVRSRSATGVRHSIGWILVHPAARRQGIARALVAQACRRAAKLAAEAVWIECRSDWAEAMAFWRAVGFEVQPRASTAAAGARRPRH
jgi:ribosomal protein S18 acetylase RimI-like enzyme